MYNKHKTLYAGLSMRPMQLHLCRQANQFATAIDHTDSITNFTGNHASRSLFFSRLKRDLFLNFCVCHEKICNQVMLILFSKRCTSSGVHLQMGVDLNTVSVRTPRVSLLYCLKWLCQYLVQAFGWFHDGCQKKGRNRLKLIQRVF